MLNYCKKCFQCVVCYKEDKNFVCARCLGITGKFANKTKEVDG